MTILDDLKKIKNLDKSGMADFIADLPDQNLKVYKLSQKIRLPKNYQDIKNVIICGMGGSGISGDIVKTLVNDQLQIPLIINRSWNLPKIANKNSLVFLVSYSGNTQETLSCAQQAIRKKSKIFIITSGGELFKIAEKSKLPILKFNYQGPPRASLGYLFMPILTVLEKLDLINLNSWHIDSSINKLKQFNQIFYPERT